jgi:Transposase DDE domain group 1
MLEKLGFKKLAEETLTIDRIPRAMTIYQFLLGMVLAIYVGFSRLNHLRFVAQDPMLTGLLQVKGLPPQCTFWRFLTSLPLTVAQQLLKLQRLLRERVWEAANVQLPSITLDTDTTVHTLYGRRMGARKSYNPKNKGKKSYQPILTFIAETREYIGGELHNGNRPTGKQMARHLEAVFAAVPRCVCKMFARADAGFYCWEAVQAYEKVKAFFLSWRARPHVCSKSWKRPTGGLLRRRMPMNNASSNISRTVGGKNRFIALRYEKKDDTPKEQYQLFETPEYIYRVFVTNMKEPIYLLVWVYNQRAGAENLIKEANNDAGLAAHPSRQWAANCAHFQLVMLAYNLNCWLMLFNREEKLSAHDLKHTTLVTARLRFLFVAAKIWRHSGRVGIRYSDQYPERGLFQRLMDRLRKIAMGSAGFRPVPAATLSG